MVLVFVVLAIFIVVVIVVLCIPPKPIRRKPFETIRCDNMRDDVCLTTSNCCPRFVSYGDTNNGDSVGYFAVPVFRCNDTVSGKARYVLEPKPSQWTRLKIPGNPNEDVPFDWYCGVSAQEINTEWGLGWDPGQDGLITNICLGLSSGLYVDSTQDFACDGNTDPLRCPSNGFVPQLLLFTTGISNGPGNAASRSDGQINILGWFTHPGGNGTYLENDITKKGIASSFLTTLELPVRGSPRASCGTWVDVLEAAIQTVACPDFTESDEDCW
jgi:hypothetical protein